MPAIAPGTHSFDNWLIDATGSLLFDMYGFPVVLSDVDESGVRFTELFDVNAAGTQAECSGTFTVRWECPVASCLWLDIKGTREVGSPAGYNFSDPFAAGAIPEPATYGMFALGLVAVGAARARRRSQPPARYLPPPSPSIGLFASRILAAASSYRKGRKA